MDLRPETAELVAKTAAMQVRSRGVFHKAELAVRPGKASGSVELAARADGSKAAHEWQFSTDQKTWMSGMPTTLARATVDGLQVGAMTWFRHRAVHGDVAQAWSQLVSMVVQ